MAIQIRLTDTQAKQMFLNAINASTPMEMGFLHFEDKKYTLNEVRLAQVGDRLEVDYFDGRMVKLALQKVEEGLWKVTCPTLPPRVDYQSWAATYPTMEALIHSVQ